MSMMYGPVDIEVLESASSLYHTNPRSQSVKGGFHMGLEKDYFVLMIPLASSALSSTGKIVIGNKDIEKLAYFEQIYRTRDLEIPAAATSGFNYVFSPLSLTTSLSLTTFSARGETQLLFILGFPTLDHLHCASDHLSQSSCVVDPEPILSFVNGA
ncbi:hypothetical protein KSP40_PGU001010 [Platanthera guangdongensis]|uniref:Uncharacterized protein n=1 Tax=Platanthera guangdongensis TaxID=2320717 RepID=A0ABR2LWA6_9ASPA